jgi:hypothetical protein
VHAEAGKLEGSYKVFSVDLVFAGFFGFGVEVGGDEGVVDGKDLV